MSLPNLVNITLQVKDDTDRERFIDSIIKVYDGNATDEDVAYVNDQCDGVYESSLG